LGHEKAWCNLHQVNEKSSDLKKNREILKRRNQENEEKKEGRKRRRGEARGGAGRKK
jgi:hypothetical protein